ncbi:MAG: T9SS type A sorting domain-containing protein [Candidatus Zixiibacteriota bacterium]|nr:MAG: T9SS type A sorting domain-containing protein [candidate division Zixibacteria bacterium]
MRGRLVALGFGAVVMGTAALVLAFPNGVNITANSGAPGETTCSCHNNLNTGPGSVSIIAPGGYLPSQTLDITVTVAEAGMSRWGFTVTALDGSDQPVGQMVITDAARTFSETEGSGREYVRHTLAGSDPGVADGTSWSFQWTAPASDVGGVTFYVAGVAANWNHSSSGDNVYSTTHTLLSTDVEEIELDELPDGIALRQNYPNPFNPNTVIEFSIPQHSNVDLAVFNILGQRVVTLFKGNLSVGHYATEWDGTDFKGNPVAGGVYYYRLKGDGFSESRKMVLLK